MLEATIAGIIMSFLVQIAKKYVDFAKQYPKVWVVVGSAVLLFAYFRVLAASQILLWLHAIGSAIMLYEMLLKPSTTSGSGH